MRQSCSGLHSVAQHGMNAPEDRYLIPDEEIGRKVAENTQDRPLPIADLAFDCVCLKRVRVIEHLKEDANCSCSEGQSIRGHRGGSG